MVFRNLLMRRNKYDEIRNPTQCDRLKEQIEVIRSKFVKVLKLEKIWRKESLVNALKPQRMVSTLCFLIWCSINLYFAQRPSPLIRKGDARQW